ncbi:uncharacterized protein [Watersipora subatra]|uniref:uncharacterized protein n=1 Tax=Watersipora subatra TaxID=2589382 RepID=UPI00355C7E60
MPNGNVTASLITRLEEHRYGPENAISGNKEKTGLNLAISAIQQSPWFQLDLSIAHCIHIIKIYKQVMGWSTDNDLANLRIAVGETDDDMYDASHKYLCAYYDGKPPGEELTITCTQRLYGRLIRVTAVQLVNRLRLREIEVFGW